MSVSIRGGIGFGRAAVFLPPMKPVQAASSAAGSSAQKTEDITGTSPEDEPGDIPWSRWGDNNLLPNEMAEQIEGCGALQSSIHDMSRLFLGKGARPYKLLQERPDGSEELEPLITTDPEIKEWLEETDMYNQSFRLVRDFIAMGNGLARLKFTKDGKRIGLVVHHDVTELRLEKKKAGVIKYAYLNAEWSTSYTFDPKDEAILKRPLVPYLRPAAYLKAIKEEQRRNKDFCIHFKAPGWLRHYYGMPMWKAADQWVEISTGVPRMKKSIFENAIRIKYMVIIYDSFWLRQFPNWAQLKAEEKDKHREDTYDMIDEYLAGADNAYKSIFVPGTFHDVSQKYAADIEIKPIDDKTKQGELLPDSAAADKQIMFTLGFNPAINGANLLSDGAKGGAGSGSDIREAIMAMILKGELERQLIIKILDIVSAVNGWYERYPNLVWRFPGLVLTTLDKGKSTEPVKS